MPRLILRPLGVVLVALALTVVPLVARAQTSAGYPGGDRDRVIYLIEVILGKQDDLDRLKRAGSDALPAEIEQLRSDQEDAWTALRDMVEETAGADAADTLPENLDRVDGQAPVHATLGRAAELWAAASLPEEERSDLVAEVDDLLLGETGRILSLLLGGLGGDQEAGDLPEGYVEELEKWVNETFGGPFDEDGADSEVEAPAEAEDAPVDPRQSASPTSEVDRLRGEVEKVRKALAAARTERGRLAALPDDLYDEAAEMAAVDTIGELELAEEAARRRLEEFETKAGLQDQGATEDDTGKPGDTGGTRDPGSDAESDAGSDKAGDEPTSQVAPDSEADGDGAGAQPQEEKFEEQVGWPLVKGFGVPAQQPGKQAFRQEEPPPPNPCLPGAAGADASATCGPLTDTGILVTTPSPGPPPGATTPPDCQDGLRPALDGPACEPAGGTGGTTDPIPEPPESSGCPGGGPSLPDVMVTCGAGLEPTIEASSADHTPDLSSLTGGAINSSTDGTAPLDPTMLAGQPPAPMAGPTFGVYGVGGLEVTAPALSCLVPFC